MAFTTNLIVEVCLSLLAYLDYNGYIITVSSNVELIHRILISFCYI